MDEFYICPKCGEVFTKDEVDVDEEVIDGSVYCVTYQCPHRKCHHRELEEAVACEACGEYHLKNDIEDGLCADCKAERDESLFTALFIKKTLYGNKPPEDLAISFNRLQEAISDFIYTLYLDEAACNKYNERMRRRFGNDNESFNERL